MRHVPSHPAPRAATKALARQVRSRSRRRQRARQRPVADRRMQTVLDALVEHVDRHLDGFAAFTVRTQWKAVDPSAPYEIERHLARRQYGPAEYWSEEQIERALLLGTLGISVCAQMLDGVLACLRSRDVLFPLAPIVRSVEERLGQVGWVLATGQSQDEWSIRDRVARVLLTQIDDMTFQKSAAKDLGKPRDIQKTALRLRELRGKPRQMFWPSEILTTKRGDFVLRGQRLPRVSELNAHIGSGLNNNWNHKGVYRTLSNATHPSMFHTFNFVSVAADGSTGWSLRDPTYLNRLVRAALVGFGTTWEQMAAYLGYPNTEMRQLQYAFDDDGRLAGL